MTIDRRGVLAGAGVGLLVAPPLASARAAGPGLRAVALRTAGMTDPLGIGDENPILSWRVEGPPGTEQAACRIRVASDRARLLAGDADQWDSGRVTTPVSTGLRYAGAPPGSRRRCHWQVRVWDAAGSASSWSAPAAWETGLLADDDWAGEWLAAESADERDDRLAAPRWTSVATADDRTPGRFRLAFDSAAGEGLLTVHTDSRLLALTLDGQALAVPGWHRDAYGDPPAAAFALPLAASCHVLTAEVAARGPAGRALAALAVLLRTPTADGTPRRRVDGWEAVGAQACVEDRPDHFPWPPTPARLFRRAFRLDAVPRRGRVYIVALGGYRLWINGIRVGDDELQTEPAEYRRHVPYRTYDVTPLLRSGENVVGVLVGDGFYASYQAPDGRYAYGPAPRRFRLMIEADGEIRAVTDTAWRHRSSPVTLSEIYAGEDHDRRLWPRDWSSPGFDDRDWDRAWPAPAPAARPQAPVAPPIR